jgi:NitT/TauT family transport system substrate-binding protein
MAQYSRATALAGISAALAASSVARSADLATIRVGGAPTDATAQHLYAQELGMFASSGINVEISTLRNSGALIAALIGGSIDVMTSTVVSVAQAHNKGIDLRAIAVGNIYDGPPPQAVIAVAPNSAVRNGADLNGKTVAVNGLGDLTQVAVAAWIDANGGDSKSVKLLEVPFPAVTAALNTGRVEAALIVEPFTSAAGKQIKILGDAQAAIGRGYMVTGWYAKADWLNANRVAARRFIDVMARSAQWGNRNHDQSAVILAKVLGLTPDAVSAAPRAIYGEKPITPAVVQPVLDFSTKYIGLEKTSAASLMWRT